MDGKRITMRVSIKEVLTSEAWIVTKVLQGYNGMVRIDAKRRWPVADQSFFFSDWCKHDTTRRYIGRRIKITHY